MTRTTSGLGSVKTTCAIRPRIEPTPIQRRSPYSSRVSWSTTSRPRKISSASAKSKPCFRMLARFFASSHTKNHCNYNCSYWQKTLLPLVDVHSLVTNHRMSRDAQSSGRRKHYFFYKSPITGNQTFSPGKVWISFASFSKGDFQGSQAPIQCSLLRFAALI
jgi:hypothetical protein